MIDPQQRQSGVWQATERLATEQAVEQLIQQTGRMAELATENGAIKLDWVTAGKRYIEEPALLERVEDEAAAILQQGVQHIIWAGMGGSVIIMHVLRALGVADGLAGMPRIYPLDSTDPGALNAIIADIAAAKGITIESLDLPAQRAVFADVLMIGVAMGITSEEPITHLTWFRDIIHNTDLPPSQHMLVMALSESLLASFAREHDIPRLPLAPDEREGLSGRMSAPATRVFLLPIALFLMGQSRERGQLRALLAAAWERFALDQAMQHPEQHPAIRLATTLSGASEEGVCQVMLTLPPGWESYFLWLEQLCEESLGKGGKGLVIFRDQPLPPERVVAARVRVALATQAEAPVADVVLRDDDFASPDLARRLVTLTTLCWNWQLAVALYGYLQGITFAGQPAVENYKSRARGLRLRQDPLAEAEAAQPNAITEGDLQLLPPPGFTTRATSPVEALAQALRAGPLTYLDLTINAELAPEAREQIAVHLQRLGYSLGVPVKLRRAPADYHSTEQSEMDGPAGIISLRVLARQAPLATVGTYTPTFLQAQAVATWQAMNEAGRSCFLLISANTSAELAPEVGELLDAVLDLVN